jgi:hypothetical protein
LSFLSWGCLVVFLWPLWYTSIKKEGCYARTSSIVQKTGYMSVLGVHIIAL